MHELRRALGRSQSYRVLVNTSGSGKTRLLLDGLCHHWGFYFVAKPDVDGIGSKDFWNLMDPLDTSLNDIAKKNRESDPAAYVRMGEKTRRHLLQLLLARLYLLNLFREEAHNGLDPMVHRRAWALLQAMPMTIFEQDPFLQLANLLSFSSVDDLKARIQEQYDLVEDMLEFGENPSDGRQKRRPLYIVFDESQLLAKQWLGEDKSDDGGLLRLVSLSSFEALEPPKILLVLSGTSIDYHALQDTLSSTTSKSLPYILVRDIGAFDDPEPQANYIKQYLPSVDNVFLNRAWAWCRGR